MSRPALYLGIDVGTSSAKVVLARATGEVVAHAQQSYPTQHPHPGWAEQQPSDWWAAVTLAVREVMPGYAPQDLGALGVSGQGCAVTLLGENGAVLRPAITWQDQRSQEQSARLRERFGQEMQRRSGKWPAPYNADPVLMWLSEHEPQTLERAAVSLTTTGYVTFRLTGQALLNASDASILCAYDLRAAGWADELIGAMGVPRRLYPGIRPCRAVIGGLTPAAASALGLSAGTPVVAGGEDTSSAALAAGVIDAGQAMVSVGTAGTVNVVQDAPITHPRLLTFEHVLAGRWLLGGSTAAFGAALEWCRRLLGEHHSFEALTSRAASAPPGAGGLIFLPYLSGELQPINDGQARGALVGFTHQHGQAHVIRAAMEGAAFALAHNLEIARRAGAEVTELRASGGPTRSSLWCQMLADITGVPLLVATAPGGAPLGTALLAASGVGAVPDLFDWARSVRREERRYRPQQNYAAAFEVYRSLYPVLQPAMHALSAWPPQPFWEEA
ncbi:xylulokinase [Deinococcus sp.]|uniref:xylulokinase n=1 Tax=Deinococcus sp. TaxID=47478 RepID=UPI003CC63A38